MDHRYHPDDDFYERQEEEKRRIAWDLRGLRKAKTVREGAWEEDGRSVSCDGYGCSGEHIQLRFKDGSWYCPACDGIMSRKEFFNYIGANELGSACETCDGNYPKCRRGCKDYDYKK